MTLLIEWDDDVDEATIVSSAEPRRASSTARKIATVVGALAALVFAMWGIRRLRA